MKDTSPNLGYGAPKVSVAMITYQQSKFVAQAIDSVLMQQTGFPVELVIGEDCSTDNTREVVRQYVAKHPDTIVPLFPESNIGVAKNWRAVLHACRGEYIAILEGDDYWTDPSKLQLQVETLDQNPNASFCFHDTEVRYEDAPSRNYIWTHDASLHLTVEQILKQWFVMTQSILLRRDKLFPFPDWGKEVWNLDWMLQLILATRGSISYIKRTMSVYRKHPGGWSNTFDFDAQERGAIALFRNFDLWSAGRYRKTIRLLIANRYLRLALNQRTRANHLAFIICAVECLWFSLPGSPIKLANMLRLLLLSPRVNDWLSNTKLFRKIKAAFPSANFTQRSSS